ncbi:DNA-binding LacI/PurR family transcriptional regulator [Nonomuraea muscovyensis]|uniref:DNA-binding LacI/PurR family transcriptional regulator n=1 Tax=Nonomuraea muscovyensis TaxID=1124761 RepID=A0A7X0C2D0_9ACTN|nr:substrate-binding domain-containing protein [Nonomuraea muscovyensis]MBB6347188.1 DNA-binding LacI/PurR family transcriptional regulator [Nonomuraea muscovyensis]
MTKPASSESRQAIAAATSWDHATRPSGFNNAISRSMRAAAASLWEPRNSAWRPSAVFAAGDTLAAGTPRAARDLGLAVPDGLAVAGFDDSDLAEALDLTTVRQPPEVPRWNFSCTGSTSPGPPAKRRCG